MKTYVIPGNPIPLARPRFSGKIVFDSQKKEKIWAYNVLKLLHGTDKMLEGALCLNIQFYMRIPKSLKKNIPLCPTTKPDLDNMIKFYSDIANGVLYEDDKQITHIIAAKFYDNNPRTEIRINTISNEREDQ